MELFLDERLCEGAVWIPREMIQAAGGVNRRLPAKQKYELMLRIVEKYSVELYPAECMPEQELTGYDRIEDEQDEQDDIIVCQRSDGIQCTATGGRLF